MKYFLVIMALVSFVKIQAQEIAAFGKPGNSAIMLYHPATGQQTDLENTTAIKKTKTKLGGFGGSEFIYVMEGEKSPVRMQADSSIFVMEKGKGQFAMDPAIAITLYRLEAGKDKRVAVLNKYTPSYAGGGGKNANTKISISAKEWKEGLQQLLPENRLEPGEYAFVTMMMQGNNYEGKHTKYIVFAFGID
jgi:hypothetical protein